VKVGLAGNGVGDMFSTVEGEVGGGVGDVLRTVEQRVGVS
jgi:hypothetical protein